MTQASVLTADELAHGLEDLIDAEVIPRHQRNHELLENPSQRYGPDGLYAPRVRELLTEVRMASAESGFYNMFVPSSAGGGGQGMESYFQCWEAVFRKCGAKYWLGHEVIAHWTRGPSFMLDAMEPSTRAQLSPGLLTGSQTLCFAMSEAEAGSDIWMMSTSATADGDGWRINGAKQWITNAPYADYAIVFAVTDPGLLRARRGGVSAFLVPMGRQGVSLSKVIKMFGSNGGNEAIVTFDNVRVESPALIGRAEEGLAIGLRGVSLGRLFNIAKAVGLTRWALAGGLEYVDSRRAFGQKLSAYQGVTFPLADTAINSTAAYLMGLHCARLMDLGSPARLELAMAKAFATEACAIALDRVVQAYGAMGLTNELGVSEAWQLVRKVSIADGSTETLKRQIVRDLLRSPNAGQPNHQGSQSQVSPRVSPEQQGYA